MSMLIPNLTELVSVEHPYRKMLKLVNFERLCEPLKDCYSNIGRGGYPLSQGFACLLLQFMDDLSDRQLELALQDSLAAKLFCGFGLTEPTPDHSYFGHLRNRIGIKRLEELFARVIKSLKDSGLVAEVFSFVDASAVHARVDVWRARDKALADLENKEKDDDGKPTMNNRNCSKYTTDPEARFGIKGKEKIWVGFKRHVCVDMKQGFITSSSIRPANEPDHKGLVDVCPSSGMVLGDKAYGIDSAKELIRSRNCYPGVIHKNNMKCKNRALEAWLTKLRMPYEGTFAALNNKARYIGTEKLRYLIDNGQGLMQALAFNLKRLIRVTAIPIIS